jgi:hypothetical protein
MKKTASQQLRKKLIVAIHCSQRYQNYYKENKDDYKKLLMDTFGVDTSKKLSIDELISLLDYLNFKTQTIQVKKDNKPSTYQMELLRKLWKDYADDTSDRALVWFLKKYNNNTLVIKPEYASKRAVQKAIIALKKTISKKGTS